MQLKSLTISSIQMVSSRDLAKNLATVEKLIVSAKQAGAEMVLLPEYFAIMANSEKEKLTYIEKHLNGPVQTFLSELAKKYSIWIVAGSHPIESTYPNKPFGRCYVYNHLGECVCWYDKIHLFDVAVDDNKKNYQESLFSTPGKNVICFDSPWGKIGLAICYDLRFPELFRQLVEMGAKIILVPAAFTFATGKVHWETLLKARAIENLCYLVASGQGGEHENGRQTWGHSCIISPWGKILSEIDFNQGQITATLDFNEQQKLRNEFPVLTHRRL